MAEEKVGGWTEPMMVDIELVEAMVLMVQVLVPMVSMVGVEYVI